MTITQMVRVRAINYDIARHLEMEVKEERRRKTYTITFYSTILLLTAAVGLTYFDPMLSLGVAVATHLLWVVNLSGDSK